jgi:hypothetical protein
MRRVTDPPQNPTEFVTVTSHVCRYSGGNRCMALVSSLSSESSLLSPVRRLPSYRLIRRCHIEASFDLLLTQWLMHATSLIINGLLNFRF